MSLIEISKGRGLTLPALLRRKYSLKPGSKLEVKDRGGEIVLTPLSANEEDIFEFIDKSTKNVSDKEIAVIKKGVRAHAFLH